MARDHYLPATLIGRFSCDWTLVMRQRRVWVTGRKRSAARQENAENVGYINNYYKLSEIEPSELVAKAWDEYERRLTLALDELVDPTVGSVDAHFWLRVLVPFIAGVFTRTPDFVRKYEGEGEEPLAERLGFNQADNTNLSRIVAMQRSFASIMAAQWVVVDT